MIPSEDKHDIIDRPHLRANKYNSEESKRSLKRKFFNDLACVYENPGLEISLPVMQLRPNGND
jgi:hypothetical protein